MELPHDLKSYRARPDGMYLLHPDEIGLLIAALLVIALVLDKIGALA